MVIQPVFFSQFFVMSVLRVSHIVDMYDVGRECQFDVFRDNYNWDMCTHHLGQNQIRRLIRGGHFGQIRLRPVLIALCLFQPVNFFLFLLTWYLICFLFLSLEFGFLSVLFLLQDLLRYFRDRFFLVLYPFEDY